MFHLLNKIHFHNALSPGKYSMGKSSLYTLHINQFNLCGCVYSLAAPVKCMHFLMYVHYSIFSCMYTIAFSHVCTL